MQCYRVPSKDRYLTSCNLSCHLLLHFFLFHCDKESKKQGDCRSRIVTRMKCLRAYSTACCSSLYRGFLSCIFPHVVKARQKTDWLSQSAGRCRCTPLIFSGCSTNWCYLWVWSVTDVLRVSTPKVGQNPMVQDLLKDSSSCCSTCHTHCHHHSLVQDGIYDEKYQKHENWKNLNAKGNYFVKFW